MTRYRAPGRVNLMGDHTDYHEGLVLPMAVDREVVVDARPAERVTVRSDVFHGVVDLPPDGSADPGEVQPAWGRTVAALLSLLSARGRPAVGLDAVITSAVPVGSGLSSSAAFAVAVATALVDSAGFDLPPVALTEVCRDAEELATGVPCGRMDQTAAVFGVEGCALRIDCRSGAVTTVPMPDDIAVVVAHSGVRRTLESSPYARRRAEAEADAAALGVASLRDATLEAVEATGRRRARHVVTENARVDATVAALAARDRPALARLFAESHRSLRDDYEVSVPELDALVERFLAAGAIGARLTGAGFGGCVVALADAADANGVARAVGGFVVGAAAGAGRVAA
ncbi:MAG TPA: galactokinase [Acidimicrobiia bacterium]|nr:galactokinase [Acidimicrobiia bacterium]